MIPMPTNSDASISSIGILLEASESGRWETIGDNREAMQIALRADTIENDGTLNMLAERMENNEDNGR